MKLKTIFSWNNRTKVRVTIESEDPRRDFTRHEQVTIHDNIASEVMLALGKRQPIHRIKVKP